MIDRVVEHFREGISNDGQHVRSQHALKVQLHRKLVPYAILIAVADWEEPRNRGRLLGFSCQAIASASGRSRSDDLMGFEQTSQMQTEGLATEPEVFTELSPRSRGSPCEKRQDFLLGTHVTTVSHCQGIVNV